VGFEEGWVVRVGVGVGDGLATAVGDELRPESELGESLLVAPESELGESFELLSGTD